MIIRGLCKRLFVTVQISLAWVITAQATPDPGIIVSDHIIGTTPASFFVLRTTTLHPPNHYQYHKRIEFVEMSVPDGNILQKCLLRGTEYSSDANVENETWKQSEMKRSPCKPFDILSKRNASYMDPRGVGLGAYSFQLGSHGVDVRQNSTEETAVRINVLRTKDLKARAARMTSIVVSSVPWKVYGSPNSEFSLVGVNDDPEFPHKTCELAPSAATARNTTWIFLHFLCWSGDGDVNGANFYMPVNKNSWIKNSD